MVAILQTGKNLKTDKRDEASQHLIASVLEIYYFRFTYKVFKDKVLKSPPQGHLQ